MHFLFKEAVQAILLFHLF